MTNTPGNVSSNLTVEPPVIDLATWRRRREQLLVREKAHTRGATRSPRPGGDCRCSGSTPAAGTAAFVCSSWSLPSHCSLGFRSSLGRWVSR